MRRILASFFFAGLMTGSAVAGQGVLSSGIKPCGDFATERENQNVYLAWALGYISGENSMDTGSMRNVGSQWTVGSVTVWLQNYCSQHPLTPFVQAADKLREELAAQEGLLPKRSEP